MIKVPRARLPKRLARAAAFCLLLAACTTPAPALVVPTPPPEVQPQAPAAAWTSLGPFETGDSWFAAWDGGNKNGYVIESVRSVDNGIRYERRARWMDQDDRSTVYGDAWVSFDADKKLVSYVLHGPGGKDWHYGRVVGGRLSRWRAGETPVEDLTVLDADRLVPGPFTGQLARLLPRIPHSVVDFQWVDPADGAVKPAYLLVIQQAEVSMPPELLAGWYIVFARRGERIHRGYMVDETRKLVIQAEGTGLNYGPRLFPAGSADEALRDLPPRLALAEEERPLLEEFLSKESTNPPR